MGFFSKLFKGPEIDMEKSNANAKKMRVLFNHVVTDGDNYRLIFGYTEDVSRFNYGFVHGSTGDGSKPNDPASVGYLNGYIDETGYKYHVYLAPYGKKGDPEITFTATGQRASRDNLAGANAGGLWAMDGVYFWTCNAIKTGQSYTFVLRKDLPGHGTDLVYSYGFSGTQAMARPVRCMRE